MCTEHETKMDLKWGLIKLNFDCEAGLYFFVLRNVLKYIFFFRVSEKTEKFN